jgi:hypothetical protein
MEFHTVLLAIRTLAEIRIKMLENASRLLQKNLFLCKTIALLIEIIYYSNYFLLPHAKIYHAFKPMSI